MAGRILLLAMFAVLPGVLRGATEDVSSFENQVPTAYELYSESPCEIRPLSGWKDIQGNIWGVGDNNLWWFNATNLSWSLLPFPNGTLGSEPWNVACGDPRKYVALVGANATLVLHLPWQHWQFVDTDDVTGGCVDPNATWCDRGSLYGLDAMRETLYLLDAEEARWTVRSDLPLVETINTTTVSGLVRTWIGHDDELMLVEKQNDCSHVIVTNVTGLSWLVVAKDDPDNSWPNLELSDSGLVLTWSLGFQKLWLWKYDQDKSEVWLFDYNLTQWQEISQKFVDKLPPLDMVITSWTDKDQFCVLKRSALCAAYYSISRTQCWKEEEIHVLKTNDELSTPVLITTSEKLEAYTSTSVIPFPPSNNGTESFSNAPELDKNPMNPKYASQSSWKSPERTPDVISIVPARGVSWHQHTSVFGSVIFFGTSLTIFGLVGFIWCVRRCVHFPKEALLLRDPPSVRYTAIPDSLGYDSRKPIPATYTVIPDSIA